MISKRRTNRIRFTWLFALVAVVALFAASCSSDSDTAATDDTKADATTTTAAAAGAAPSDADIKALTTSVAGGGASFPDAFYQAVNTDFNGVAGTERVTYAKSGSSDGRAQLIAGTVDYAGSDSLPKDTEVFPGTVLFFPTVAAPITVSYNLSGVEKLQLSPDVLAGIFSAQITTWDDAKIAADNPDAKLPSTPITVVHRSDGSGTTNNLTKYLTAASPTVWTLASGDEVNWPASTQGAEKNSGVAEVIKQTDGAVGYIDLADAGKAGLSFAAIQNSSGDFIQPSVEGVQAALEGADVAPNLTYNPLNGSDPAAYPITAPTWLLVIKEQTDAAKAATIKTYLQYVLTTGQEEASKTGYVALPESLAEQAIEQIDQIQG
ncbi:phosphate ABC transporter substrate-binding protein PstS [soil metagenome]